MSPRLANPHAAITPETLRALIELTHRFGDDLRRFAIEVARRKAAHQPTVDPQSLLEALPLALDSLRESVTREALFGGKACGSATNAA
jgi:hypothetical protein